MKKEITIPLSKYTPRDQEHIGPKATWWLRTALFYGRFFLLWGVGIFIWCILLQVPFFAYIVLLALIIAAILWLKKIYKQKHARIETYLHWEIFTATVIEHTRWFSIFRWMYNQPRILIVRYSYGNHTIQHRSKHLHTQYPIWSELIWLRHNEKIFFAQTMWYHYQFSIVK